MSPVTVIATNALRRLVRERSNLFFVFIFPMLMVLLIGLQFGGPGDLRMAVVAGDDLATQVFVERLDDSVEVVRLGSRDDALDRVARGEVDGVVLVTGDLEAALARGDARIEMALRPQAQALRATVDAALSRTALAHQAAASVAEVLGVGQDEALAATRTAAASLGADPVTVTDVGTDDLAAEFSSLGQFDLGASSQTLLFVFLTSLAGGTAIIEARQFGVTRRILATPTTAGQIVAGEGLGRFAVAIVQAGYLVVGTLAVFGVSWGAPLPAALVMLAFCAVGAGAGALLGAVADNLEQAGGLSVMASLVLAALGGCMIPLELFPDTVRTFAHVTPHAWGNEAFAELVRRDGGLADVAPHIGVLVGFAVALWAAATWRLQRRLTT